ncbi:DUF6969 family protein [Parerythrobacter jejuensis]|uniref:DUF6969 domain-containing protein n=1 Tax=Parerythrobacter jejuensis TaxID=795812 RepID=A0A845AQR8_9SPHN|nr:hypothetical protein [Parerythrobacter jejuensis]MXP31235.1 hypothetical protein [Parerythrobacter jejuensis]MXP33995.1 hypothetical protein [Parerythrobacter jejuensis]
MPQADAITTDRSRAALLALSADMAAEGAMLIQRVLPAAPDAYRQWEHYPEGDAIDPDSRARWFYHAHPPEQRAEGEHGHFHVFLPLSAFDGVEPLFLPKKEDAVKVVHVAGLNFDCDGLPTSWMTVNQWVTDEYVMPAEAIIDRLDHLVLDRAGEKAGMEKVGQWLTLALRSCRIDIAAILRERDARLAAIDPRDTDHEILSARRFSLD